MTRQLTPLQPPRATKSPDDDPDTVILGYVVWIDGAEPIWDGNGPRVFGTKAEAKEAKDDHPLGLVSTISPVTSRRRAEIIRERRLRT